MLDQAVKLLIVLFALAVGSCFAFWPGRVLQRFTLWRGYSVESRDDESSNIRKEYTLLWFRQMGVFLLGLTCYAIYLWISQG